MSSRNYPERITFYSRSVTRTASGKPEEVWTQLFNRHAAVKCTKPAEGVSNKQHQNSQDYTISLPSDTSAAAKDPQETKVVWHSKTGDITINLTGRDIRPGRRPELVFSGTSDSD